MAGACAAFIDRQVVLQTLVSNADKVDQGLTAKEIKDYWSLMD